MIGLLVLLLISWGLLYLIEKKNLEAIGVIPTRIRAVHMLLGLTILVVVCLLLIGIETKLKSIAWQYTGLRMRLLGEALIYHLRSALTEDLVFRGALLYILIQRLGVRWGILISAVIFGVYHVFSYGITDERWILIGYVIVVTGCMGYVWAYIFHKTNSIYMGLGMHLGYNMLMCCFYPSQPFGESLFTQLSSVELSEPLASFYSIFRGLFPPVMAWILFKVAQWSGVVQPVVKLQD